MLMLMLLLRSTIAGTGLHGPTYQEPHPDRIEGETMYSFRGLSLTIQETKYGAHATHRLAHRFDRLKHPHSNPDLWHFVKDICATTWNQQTKPTDHHFAATVDIFQKTVQCWSAYHTNDVVDWETVDGNRYVTYLATIEALGAAPRALWSTDKWCVQHHGPFYSPTGHASLEL